MGEVGCCESRIVTNGRANPLMDRQVVGVVFFMVAMVAAGCSVV